MPLTLVEPMASIYAPNPTRTEKYRLLTEPKTGPKAGALQLRALNGFLLIKNGKFVFPTYGAAKSEEWWTGVEAYGYMAALTGEYKYLIWSGHWEEEDTPGRHLEVVKLENIVAMSKERNVHWRAKSELILWLETKNRIAYALLEPADEYNPLEWKRVVDSWTNAHEFEAGPAHFHRTDPKQRPAWWPKAGDVQWKRVQQLLSSREPKTEKKGKGAESRRGVVDAPRKAPKKRKDVTAMSSEESRNPTSQSPRRKRRRPSDDNVSDGPSMQQSKITHHVEVPSSPSLGEMVIHHSSQEEGPDGSDAKEPSPPPAEQPAAPDSRQRRRSKGKKKELIGPSNEGAARTGLSPSTNAHPSPDSDAKWQASAPRVQNEAQGEMPGPATQEASAMPSSVPPRRPGPGPPQTRPKGGKGKRDVAKEAPMRHTAPPRESAKDLVPVPGDEAENSSVHSTSARPTQKQTQTQPNSDHGEGMEPTVALPVSDSQPTEQLLGLSLAEPTTTKTSVAVVSTQSSIPPPDNGHKVPTLDLTDVSMAKAAAPRPVRTVRASTVPPSSGVGLPVARYSVEAAGSMELDLDNRSSRRYDEPCEGQ